MKSSQHQIQALSSRLLEFTAVTKTKRVPVYPKLLSAADKLISGKATTMADAVRMAALEPTVGMTELVMDITIGYFTAWKATGTRPVGYLANVERGALITMRHAAHAATGGKGKLTKDGYERNYMKERKSEKAAPPAVAEPAAKARPSFTNVFQMDWSKKPDLDLALDLPRLAFPQ